MEIVALYKYVMTSTLRAGLLLIGFAPLYLGAEEPAALRRFEFSQPKMGTLFRIVLYAPDETTARRAGDAAFARIDELNALFSDYSAQSELSKLCAASGGPPVAVSPELFEILSVSQQAARRTDGAFDVTLGPLIKLWRLSREQKKLPLPERLAAAKERSGDRFLHLDLKTATVRLEKPEMRLDLGGIAKGYAADTALVVLNGQGLRHVLIAAGGDIRVGKAPPGEKGWKVAVAPLHPKDPPSEFLLLEDAAVSTSGDAAQHVEIGGVRYSHIVDRKTGLGMNCKRSVTVVAPNGTTSDWMDTAVYVLGAERGMELIESEVGVSALFIDWTAQGLQRHESSRWKTLTRP